MKRIIIGTTSLLIFTMAVIMMAQDSLSEKDIGYRPATVAGSFYPDNPDTLRAMIKRFLVKRPSEIEITEIIGLVAPHAGYAYSGWIAGKGYAEVEGRHYDAVIVIAPSHQKYFSGSSVFKGDAYVTPLGNCMVDKTLARKIGSYFPEVQLSMEGHEWKGKSEHSLEVQIPFIQVALPGTPVVPIVMGSQDPESQDFLIRAIVSAVKEMGKKVLIVASSDLSHYHDRETARNIDKELVQTFSRFDYYRIGSRLQSKEMEACGGGPIVVMMTVAEQLGANVSASIRYATSADSPDYQSDSSRVVGYFSGMVLKVKGALSNTLPLMEESDKVELIKAAKSAIKRAIANEKDYKIKTIPMNLVAEFPAFVTLRKNGRLRGCMGHTYSNSSVYIEVEEAAKLAALNDPRFDAVSEKELDSLDIEVTILSRMQRQMNPENLRAGIDGALLRVGRNSGLFLPVVATEQGWDKTTFLEQLGRKAGLSTDAYKERNAILYTFQTIVLDSEKYGSE